MKQFLRLLCLLGVVVSSHSARSEDKPKPATQHWFDVTDMTEEVFAPKKPLVLTQDQAVQLFGSKNLSVVPRWRDKLKTFNLRIEDVAAGELPGKFVRKFTIERMAFAAVQKFSKQNVQVMILKPYGQYLWHQYEECLAVFEIPRNIIVDKLFDVPALETIYCARVKGIGYGDSRQTVFKALGEPDVIYSYQPAGWLDCAFFDEDVVIHFEDYAVKTITLGVPENIKVEAKEKGKHIVR